LRIALPNLQRYNRDTRLIFGITVIYSVAFFGINMLIKRLFLLRLGHPTSFLSLFNAIAAFAYMATGLPAGAIGRRIGPRPLLWIGVVATLVGFGLLPLACGTTVTTQKALLLGGQVFLAVGWSIINVSLMTSLAVTSDDTSRASAYAMYNALMGLGTLLGNLVGGVLPSFFAWATGQPEAAPVNYAWTLFVAFCLVLLTIPPLLRIGPMRLQEQDAAEGDPVDRSKPPRLRIAMLGLMVMLTQGSVVSLSSFGSAYMDSELLMSAAVIGAILALGKLFGVGASLVSPRLMRMMGAGRVVVVSSLLLTISVLPVALVPHWSSATLSMLIYLVTISLWSPAAVTYEMDWISADWRSLMSGTHAMSMGMIHSLLNLGVSGVIDDMGHIPIFAISGGLSLLGTLLAFAIQRVRARGMAGQGIPS